MRKTLLEQLEDKFEEVESIAEDEIEEANVTGNMDGGAGPAKTPHTFGDGKSEPSGNHIEVLGYKKTKPSNMHTKRLQELERNLENQILEISYKDYKKDDTRKDYQKINDSIIKINRMVFEMEKLVNLNIKLKQESSVSNAKYWESTKKNFGKISKRMLRISRKITELNL